MNIETTKERLLQLEKEIKSLSLKKDIEFHQQRVKKTYGFTNIISSMPVSAFI